MSLLNSTSASSVLRIAARPCMRQTLAKPLPICTSQPLSTLRPFAPATTTTTKTNLLAPLSSQPLLLLLRTQTRLASTAAPSSSASAAAGAGAATEAQLNWNDFFQLRKTRRRIQVLFSIAGAASCGTAGSWVLAAGIAEPLLALIPLDPFITMGLMAFSSATLGWLLGPIVGAGVFNMWHRRIKPQMAAKEKEFFARVKKHRVDPTTSSVGNPVPDFYGEKISSVAGYRRWLKDQRAYNKKRMTFV